MAPTPTGPHGFQLLPVLIRRVVFVMGMRGIRGLGAYWGSLGVEGKVAPAMLGRASRILLDIHAGSLNCGLYGEIERGTQ